MVSHELAVEQLHARPPQGRHQPCKRHLGCVGHPAEHRFTAEHPVEPHPVQPADQPAILPAFDRMGMAAGVQLAIARRDPAADPGLVRFAARRGAGFEDGREIGIAGDGETAAPQGSRQRARTAKAIKRKNGAAVRFHPEYLGIVAGVGHRKDAAAIGHQQQVGIDRRRVHGRLHGRAIADHAAKADKFLANRLRLT